MEQDLYNKIYKKLHNLILLNDYYNANNCLNNLKNEIINDNLESNYDFGIIESLLAYLNDYSANLLVSENIYLDFQINDEYILNKYSALLDYIAESDFYNANLLATNLNSYAKQNNIEIDFSLLCLLLNDCANKQRNQNEEIKQKIIQCCLKSKRYRDLYEMVLNKTQLLPIKYNVYKIITILVENGFVKEGMNLYDNIDDSKHNITMDKFLNDANKEEELLEKIQEEYKQGLYDIRKNMRLENYVNAINIGFNYYNLSKSPFFLYYIAKCYYRLNCYEDAINVLMIYLKQGSIKFRRGFNLLEECYEKLYISPIKIPSKLREYYYSLASLTGSRKSVCCTKIKSVKEINNYNLLNSPLYLRLQNLYLDGLTYQADKEIKDLMQREITKEEKDVLQLIKKNRKVLLLKNK